MGDRTPTFEMHDTPCLDSLRIIRAAVVVLQSVELDTCEVDRNVGRLVSAATATLEVAADELASFHRANKYGLGEHWSAEQ